MGRHEVRANFSIISHSMKIIDWQILAIDAIENHFNNVLQVGFVQDTKKTPLHDGKGCRFEGHFFVNKVPGNFHVSTHSASSQPTNIDMSHYINELRFGDDVRHLELEGGFNTLAGRDMTMSNGT